MQSDATLPARLPLTVVIPAFQEAEAIRSGRLEEVLSWAAARPEPTEVLVVDDGSSDETATLAAACGATVRTIPHGGKAAALRAGIEHARGEIVLLTDMDLATPIGEAPALLAALEGGADVALGSRGRRRTGAPPGRWLMSLGHGGLQRLLVGLPWADTQCGFKAFRRDASLPLLARLRRYGPGSGAGVSGPSVGSGFDVELLLAARRAGLRVAEVPVSWHYRRTHRVSKLRDAWRGALDLLAIARADRAGAYAPPSPPGGGLG